MKRWWTGLAIVAVLAAAGCGGASAPSSKSSPASGGPRLASGVEGRVLLVGGPMVADQSPSPNPYPASEVAAYDSSGRLVALVRPDRDAAFRIELPPGSYAQGAFDRRQPRLRPAPSDRRASGGFARADIVAQVP